MEDKVRLHPRLALACWTQRLAARTLHHSPRTYVTEELHLNPPRGIVTDGHVKEDDGPAIGPCAGNGIGRCRGHCGETGYD